MPETEASLSEEPNPEPCSRCAYSHALTGVLRCTNPESEFKGPVHPDGWCPLWAESCFT